MNQLKKSQELILGKSVTLEDFVSVARYGAQVSFSEIYKQRVSRARALVDRWVELERQHFSGQFFRGEIA